MKRKEKPKTCRTLGLLLLFSASSQQNKNRSCPLQLPRRFDISAARQVRFTGISFCMYELAAVRITSSNIEQKSARTSSWDVNDQQTGPIHKAMLAIRMVYIFQISVRLIESSCFIRATESVIRPSAHVNVEKKKREFISFGMCPAVWMWKGQVFPTF